MDEFLYYTNLYDIYKELLTKTQIEYFEYYYFDNLSYGEIAENKNISRSGVFRQINLTIKKLIKFENTLHLFDRKEKIEELIKNIDDINLKKELENIIEKDD